MIHNRSSRRSSLPQSVAWVMQRLLSNMPVGQGIIDSLSEPYKGWVPTLLASNGSRQQVLEGLILASPLAEIKAVDPEATYPIETDNHNVDYPQLPTDLASIIDNTECKRSWIDDYTDHALTVSPMTPRSFHESAALAIASIAIAGRLKLKTAFAEVYPNLYILWIAKTTLHRKTTAMDYARSVVRRSFPHLLGPQQWTPEALVSDITGTPPSNYDKMPEATRTHWLAQRNFAAQRGLIIDEMSGMLAGASRDYNKGLLELLLQLYDTMDDHERSTRGQGYIVAHHACFTLLGASTPSALANHLSDLHLWNTGWWPRFALLTPENDYPEWQIAREVTEPDRIITSIKRLYDRLPMPTYPTPPKSITVGFDGDAYALWERYNKTLGYDLLVTNELPEQIYGSYGRFPTHTLKVALILSALDWPTNDPSPRIEYHHLVHAIRIVESWRQNLHHLLSVADETNLNAISRRIIRQLAMAGQEGMTVRDLWRNMRDKPQSKIEAGLDLLISSDEAEMFTKQGKRGRPTEYFRLLT